MAMQSSLIFLSSRAVLHVVWSWLTATIAYLSTYCFATDLNLQPWCGHSYMTPGWHASMCFFSGASSPNCMPQSFSKHANLDIYYLATWSYSTHALMGKFVDILHIWTNAGHMITFAPGKRSRAFGFWFYYPFVAVCLMRNQILLAAVRRVALVTGVRIGNCNKIFRA